MTRPRPHHALALGLAGLVSLLADSQAQVHRLDASDRAAFRSWFVLLVDAQFERAAPEVTDCAALVRFAFREALRPHTSEWARRIGLPPSPSFPDVRSAPKAGPNGWPLFRVARDERSAYAEFADARTIVALNARRLGRGSEALQPGDLLYFHQPEQAQPDHLMIFVGRSFFDAAHTDWVVYHTGPTGEGPGEVRKTRLHDLRQHPSPRWRPIEPNRHFVGVYRLSLL